MPDGTAVDCPRCELHEYSVTVGSKPYIVCVSRSSEDVWTAAGDYDGKWLEATSASETSAVADWQQEAESQPG